MITVDTFLQNGVISPEESVRLTEYISSLDNGVDNIVPDALFNIIERINLFMAKGTLQ